MPPEARYEQSITRKKMNGARSSKRKERKVLQNVRMEWINLRLDGNISKWVEVGCVARWKEDDSLRSLDNDVEIVGSIEVKSRSCTIPTNPYEALFKVSIQFSRNLKRRVQM